jgi:hypothetical protein
MRYFFVISLFYSKMSFIFTLYIYFHNILLTLFEGALVFLPKDLMTHHWFWLFYCLICLRVQISILVLISTGQSFIFFSKVNRLIMKHPFNLWRSGTIQSIFNSFTLNFDIFSGILLIFLWSCILHMDIFHSRCKS